MTRQTFDLHVHAWYSYDAHLAPEQIFAAAAEKGVAVAAIADHHNMDGLDDYARAAEGFSAVRLVRAMEISVDTDLGAFDVVALGVPADAPRRLADVVDTYRTWMRDLNQRILAGFRAVGVPFGPAEAQEMDRSWRPGPGPAAQGEVRLPNVGLTEWLLGRGVIGSAKEFGALMKRALAAVGGRPAMPGFRDVLPRFTAVGAVLILAHPQALLARVGEEAVVRFLAEAGIDGVEAGHIGHTQQQAEAYADLARRHGLYISGGSDIHFPPDIDRLGDHRCQPAWAAPLLERLGV
ncbi:MAG TPA: PHP domain-containing protein [Phycisphaerae bacterium]|nr:PHP domain-containing protein [Phycisphaerae bacterium]